MRNLEQPLSKWNQLLRGQSAMSLIHGLCQSVGDACSNPHHGGLFDAELHRDGIGSFETDTSDVARQTIGIFSHYLDCIGTVGLENPHRSSSANCVAVQENHDFPHRLLFSPSS